MDKQKTQSKKLSPKELQEFESFKKWLTDKNYSPKNEEEVKKYYAQYQLEKAKASTEQKQKALHGAKLNYFKSLKNQCAEDEEVVYYKKGGSVTCGCKKKEDGGQVNKAEDGWKAKFKARKMLAGGKKVTTKEGWDNKGNYIVTKEGIDKRKKLLEANKNEEGQADPNKKLQQTKQSLPNKLKPTVKAKLDHMSCGSKIKKHQEGSVIAQFKAYRKGGSLNGIPFMQQGKDLPTAPKAEKRFRKNSYNTTKEGNRETTTITSQTFGYNRNWPYFRQPATILRIIEGGDTAFVETPEHHILTKVLPRTALKSGNIYVEYNPKYDENYSLGGQANTLFNYSINPLEYEILKRRFNTAWNLAK